ncbi:MAG: hypothetical protein KDG55_04075 [Rhodocyclaceae bacterium]|nr:hypothetical protein [Rhodocyclaceae bacterium]
MSHPTADQLAAAVGRAPARAGAFRPGDGAYVRGRRLHEACRDWSWFEVYLLALTGREFAPAEVSLLQTLWTYTSYPDGRIWNNRVAALAGSARSAASLAVGAALAVSDAHIYGAGPFLEAHDFFLAHRDDDDAALLAAVRVQLATKRRVGGYGRPVTAADERIAPILARARALGLDDGHFLQLALRVERLLLAGRWRMQMNYAAPVAALCLDLGLDRMQCEAFASTIFLAGMPAVWIEAARQRPAGSFLPLPSRILSYEGPPPRPWPRSAAQ